MTKREDALTDREPSLWELAAQERIAQAVPPDNPQPAGVWCPWAGPDFRPAADLRTRRMRFSLWGPPDRITLSMLKTDVWDRRFKWEPPVTWRKPSPAPCQGQRR